jgi:hypothetical protein
MTTMQMHSKIRGYRKSGPWYDLPSTARRRGSRAGRKRPIPRHPIPAPRGPRVSTPGSQPPPSCPFSGLLRPAPTQTHRAHSRPGTLFIISLGRLGFAPSLCLLRPCSPSSPGDGTRSSRSPPCFQQLQRFCDCRCGSHRLCGRAGEVEVGFRVFFLLVQAVVLMFCRE